MANSITGIGGSSSSTPVDIVGTSRTSGQTVSAAPGTSDSAPVQVSDATSLSNLGSFIASVAKLASAQSSTRPEVVASLKAQIAAGTYNPDPDEVAASVAAALNA